MPRIPKATFGDAIPEGVSVLSAPAADYFHFRKNDDQITIRVPKDPLGRLEITHRSSGIKVRVRS